MTASAPERIRVQLPPLHPGQREVDECSARFVVCVCGRRWGKTTYGVRKCFKGALQTGGIYWWIAPSYKVANIGWRMTKKLAALMGDLVEVKEADKCIKFKNGGEIWMKSADDPDSLRGEKLSGAVFDEFAQIKPETWTEVIRPALSDLKGWALFIGTPKGKNWAYRLYQMGTMREDWASFRKPTSTNPYIDKAEIEAARLDMSQESFAQEYEADFGASQYLVYPEFEDVHIWKGPMPEFVSYHGGLDFGGDSIGAHKSAGVGGGRTKNDELIIIAEFEQAGPNIAERQVNWVLEQETLIQELRKEARQRPLNPTVIWRADKSQMTGIQLMRSFGISVFKTTGGSDSVTGGIEMVHRRLKLRPDGEGRLRPRLYVWERCHRSIAALQRYRWPEPKDEDKPQAKNPLKVDDDLADAIRYLVEGVDGLPVGNPQEMYAAMLPRYSG